MGFLFGSELTKYAPLVSSINDKWVDTSTIVTHLTRGRVYSSETTPRPNRGNNTHSAIASLETSDNPRYTLRYKVGPGQYPSRPYFAVVILKK